MKKKLVSIFVLVMSVLFLAACGKPKLSDSVEVTFSGYDEFGQLDYNNEGIELKLKEEILKSLGFKKEDIDILVTDTRESMQLARSSSDNIAKLEKAQAILDSVEYGFDKTADLKNGDEVVFTVHSDFKDSPVENEEKTFKVTGLKPVEKVVFDDVIKPEQYAITGYEGYGRILVDTSVLSVVGSHEDHLSNGEKIKIEVLPFFIKELAKEGKVLTETSKEVEVKDLLSISSIENLPEIFAKIPDLARSQNKDKDVFGDLTTYTLEPQGDFLLYEESYLEKEPLISVKTIYKVTKTQTYNNQLSGKKGQTESKEYYKIYGYIHLKTFENKLILSDLDYKGSYDFSEYLTLDSAISELKSENFSEYNK